MQFFYPRFILFISVVLPLAFHRKDPTFGHPPQTLPLTAINIIDVGANIGQIFSELVLPVSLPVSYFVFEPNPFNLAILTSAANMLDNVVVKTAGELIRSQFNKDNSPFSGGHKKQVTVFPHAASNFNGQASFFFNHPADITQKGNQHGALGASPRGLNEGESVDDGKNTDVEVVTLDSIFFQNLTLSASFRINLLKTDTEGYDVLVLISL